MSGRSCRSDESRRESLSSWRPQSRNTPICSRPWTWQKQSASKTRMSLGRSWCRAVSSKRSASTPPSPALSASIPSSSSPCARSCLRLSPRGSCDQPPSSPYTSRCSRSSTPSCFKLEDIELQHIYRALDVLAAAKDDVETSLFAHGRDLFTRQVDVVLYDLTTLRFESTKETETLRRFGYSKVPLAAARGRSSSRSRRPRHFARADGPLGRPQIVRKIRARSKRAPSSTGRINESSAT